MQYITEPKSTRDIVFSNDISQQFIALILNRSFPFPHAGKTALCFYGTYGTGKTTYAKLFCEDFENLSDGSLRLINLFWIGWMFLSLSSSILIDWA